MTIEDEILRASLAQRLLDDPLELLPVSLRSRYENVNDALAIHFGRQARETIQDAEFRWLGEQGGTGGTIDERWQTAFGPGEINEIKWTYWSNKLL